MRLKQSKRANRRSLAQNKTDEAKAKEREELTNYAFKLYRRVLQQEENNKRAMYYVAYQMAQRNDLPTARSMMNKLAPDEKKVIQPHMHGVRSIS